VSHQPLRDLCSEVREHDVVIVGSGLAGLSAALVLAPRAVALLTKGELGQDGASNLAQGGIAAACDPEDSADQHAHDTIAAGAGLCDTSLVLRLTGEAPRAIERLVRLGARFDRDPDGGLLLGREGAHGRRRILHANGDATGGELVRALAEAVAAQPNLERLEGHFALELAHVDDRVVGVLARDSQGRAVLHTGRVILASGGMGRVYLRSTSPLAATGDGLAMAARAGACLADLEFVQFHPTALSAGLDPLPLVSEAVRGEGAILVDERGERFMTGIHPAAELAPRDVVARAIWRQEQDGHRVFLDATRTVGDRFPARFPTVFAHCRRAGVDPRRQPIPVTPAAHYSIGGVATDESGRTSLAGLWACGEVAATGVHGGNRLASNSLLEALVFGDRVGRDVAASEPMASGDWLGRAVVGVEPSAAAVAPAETQQSVRRLMWQQVGLVRDAEGLRAALEKLEAFRPAPAGETANLLAVACLVTAAALFREESRGAHYRTDFPEPREEWRHRQFWRYDPEAAGPTAPLVADRPPVGVAGEVCE
jgi:L-aspartate oxidase